MCLWFQSSSHVRPRCLNFTPSGHSSLQLHSNVIWPRVWRSYESISTIIHTFFKKFCPKKPPKFFPHVSLHLEWKKKFVQKNVYILRDFLKGSRFSRLRNQFSLVCVWITFNPRIWSEKKLPQWIRESTDNCMLHVSIWYSTFPWLYCIFKTAEFIL